MIRPVRLFLLIGLLLASGGLAQPPSAALDYISGASLGAEAVMERSLAELRRSQLGLSGSLGIDPTLNYFINYDTVDPATFDFFLDIDLGIDYRFDLAAIIADRRDLVRSEDRYFDQRRRDVETALLIHTELLRAQNAVAFEEFDLASEQTRFAEVEQSFRANEASQAQLDAAELNLDSDQVALDRAHVRVDRARSDALRRGLGASPSFEVLQFVLPDPAPEQTFQYRQLMFELQLADVIGLQSTAFGVLQAVGLAATYEFDDYTFGANVNLNRGRPGAGVDANLDFPFDEIGSSPSITLAFDIRVDDGTPRDFTEAERNLANAQANLEEFLAQFAANAARERQDIMFAWEDLQRALRQLDINRARIAELEAQRADLPAEVVRLRTAADELRVRRDAATGDDRNTLDDELREADDLLRTAEGQLGRTEGDIANLNNGLPRSLDGVYSTWGNYVRAVEDYLGVVDGAWVLPETE